jgi:hypothetical protein
MARFSSNVSNPTQRCKLQPVKVELLDFRVAEDAKSELLLALPRQPSLSSGCYQNGKKERGSSMGERRSRNGFRSRIADILGSFTKLFGMVKPAAPACGTQRMCPSCGLITPRGKPLCLECGKPLRVMQLERKDARRG